MIDLMCSIASCDGDATVPGVWAPRDPSRSVRRVYCRTCAERLWSDGSFQPDNEADLHAASDFREEQARRLAEFEESPPAPESFDARAAVLRVRTLVQTWIDEADAHDRLATEFVRKRQFASADRWDEEARIIRARAREVHRTIEGGDGA